MNSTTSFQTTRTATSITTVTTTIKSISPWKTNSREYKQNQKKRTDRKQREIKQKFNTNNRHGETTYGRKNGKSFEIFNEFEDVSNWDIDTQFMTKKELDSFNSAEAKNEFLKEFHLGDKNFSKKHGTEWQNIHYNKLCYYGYYA
tara:strand:- start:4514 stop:4948 length:435 start_codon:yes stop_codon:yes gene_type:complete